MCRRFFRRFCCVGLFALFFGLHAILCRADVPVTLAQALALASAAPPKDDLFLTVGAEQVLLPPDAVPPTKDASVSETGQAYGRIARDFGVIALAPPTMTLLNTDPGTPSPYEGLPPNDALKMLLASLSDAQWKALTSEAGLGPSELTGDAQRALLAAYLPSGKIIAHLQRGLGNIVGGPDDGITLTGDDLQAVHLRLGQRVQVGLPIEGQPNSTLIPGDSSTTGKPQYVIYGGENGSAKDRLYGAVVRQTVPNVSKASDLDFEKAILKKPIPWDGVKTVGDLLFRIGGVLKIELYADRRYEKRSVTLLGPAAGRARDLLRALALCVCGTYRRVGPAYVLTNDQLGLGPRRRILSRFAQEAAMARSQAMADAGDRLVTVRGGVEGLPALGDGLGFSDAQKALAHQPDQGQAPGQGITLSAPLAKLTPDQQALARRQTQQWNDAYDANPHPDEGIGHVTLAGTFRLSSQPALLLLSPKVPGPVTMNFSAWNLFQPSSKLREALSQKQQAEREAAQEAHPALPVPPMLPVPPIPSPPAPLPLSTVFARQPRRAVVASPRTVKEVDLLIAAMKTVGLNQLWLDVFSGGKSHLGAEGEDILIEALAKTKGTSISVFPMLDLLKWGKDAPAGAADLTVMGETSAQAAAWEQHYQNIVNQNMTPEEADKQPAPTDLSVFPFSDPVQQTLTALVKRLAGTEGVGALVLRETVTPGYNRPAGSRYGSGEDDLGYTPPLRLALLRKDHVDPVDLDPGVYIEGFNVDLSLPEFEDYTATETVGKDWDALRLEANAIFLRGLLAAAQGAAGRRLPLLIKQRRENWQGNWYGLWDDPRAPLPELSEEKANGMGGPDFNYAAFAHTQCRTNVFVLNSWEAQSKEGLAGALQSMKPGWDGFVLDYSGTPVSGSGDSALASLAASIAPPPAPKPPAK